MKNYLAYRTRKIVKYAIVVRLPPITGVVNPKYQ